MCLELVVLVQLVMVPMEVAAGQNKTPRGGQHQHQQAQLSLRRLTHDVLPPWDDRLRLDQSLVVVVVVTVVVIVVIVVVVVVDVLDVVATAQAHCRRCEQRKRETARALDEASLHF